MAQATAAQKAALLNYELTIQNAFADVDNALVARQKLIAQQAAQERLVKALSEYERLATLQYKGGVTPYSTVLQAQQALFPQELNLAQTRYAVLQRAGESVQGDRRRLGRDRAEHRRTASAIRPA